MNARIAELHPSLKVRRNEPVAFHRELAKLFEFNRDGAILLQLIDGQRNLAEVALLLSKGNEALAARVLPACTQFVERCVDAGALHWKS